MDAEEIRFRLACEGRKAAALVRARIAPRQWRRGDLASILASPSSIESEPLAAARRALSAADLSTVHARLAQHFNERAPCFVLDPPALPDLVRRIRLRFPGAQAAAEAWV